MIRKDRDALEATCQRCLETQPRHDLDRLLWCDACREAVLNRAASRGWLVGLAVAVALALWIWLYVQPSLMIGGWIGVVLAAFYFSARVSREVLYAVARTRMRATDWGATAEEPTE